MEKIKMENTEKLEEVYDFVYTCEKCNTKYGCDKEEKSPHLCPICESDSFSNK